MGNCGGSKNIFFTIISYRKSGGRRVWKAIRYHGTSDLSCFYSLLTCFTDSCPLQASFHPTHINLPKIPFCSILTQELVIEACLQQIESKCLYSYSRSFIIEHYSLKVCIPPQFLCWKITPSVMTVKRWGVSGWLNQEKRAFKWIQLISFQESCERVSLPLM